MFFIADHERRWTVQPVIPWQGFINLGCDITELSRLRLRRLTDAVNAAHAILGLAEVMLGPVEPVTLCRPRDTDRHVHRLLGDRVAWVADTDTGQFAFISPRLLSLTTVWDVSFISEDGSVLQQLNESGYRTLREARLFAAQLAASPHMSYRRFLKAWLAGLRSPNTTA